MQVNPLSAQKRERCAWLKTDLDGRSSRRHFAWVTTSGDNGDQLKWASGISSPDRHLVSHYMDSDRLMEKRLGKITNR
jgi:hypothetical protein